MIEDRDQELAQSCQRGDRRAFEELVQKYQKTVFNVAFRMTHDRQDAEDVAQSAFVKAYEKIGTFDPKFRFFSWLYRIVVNESLNFLKQRRQYNTLEEDVAADDTEVQAVDEETETNRKIQDGLMQLKLEQRAVIVLRHFQNLSYGEIAQVLDISEKKVKSRLFAARMTLRELLLRKGLGSHD
jgi:RNA polymerase sigma-70 factor (ECF subfamily)